MAKKKQQTSAYIEKRREQKRLSMKRAREKLKLNPVLHAEAKAKDRDYKNRKKAEGKIKTIANMTRREQRAQRAVWRQSAARSRYRKAQAQAAQTLEPVEESSKENSNRLIADRRRKRTVRNECENNTLKSRYLDPRTYFVELFTSVDFFLILNFVFKCNFSFFSYTNLLFYTINIKYVDF